MTHFNNTTNLSKFYETREVPKQHSQTAVDRDAIRLLLPQIKEELLWFAEAHLEIQSELRESSGSAKRNLLSSLRFCETKMAKCIVAYELYAPVVGEWDEEIRDLIATYSKVIARHWDE